MYSKIRNRQNLRDAKSVVQSACEQSDSRSIKAAWTEFARRLDRHLDRIADHLRREIYEFSPASGVVSRAPGKSGRPIAIYAIQDRIVQRSLLQVLSIFEPVRSLQNQPRSYGGIRGKGVHDALLAVKVELGSGMGYYIRSDIKAFFRNVPRELVLEKIRGLGVDEATMTLLKGATDFELDQLSRLSGSDQELFPTHELGVAQGNCLSPLLANILLSDFDTVTNSQGSTCFRYIDDFLILAPTREKALSALKRGQQVLGGLGLSLYEPSTDPHKADCGGTGSAINFLGCDVNKDFVHPDKKTRSKIVRSTRELFDKSIQNLGKSKNVRIEHSFAQTLKQADDRLHAWSAQYAFCGPCQALRAVDLAVQLEVARYERRFKKIDSGSDSRDHNRLLGVRPIVKKL